MATKPAYLITKGTSEEDRHAELEANITACRAAAKEIEKKIREKEDGDLPGPLWQFLCTLIYPIFVVSGLYVCAISRLAKATINLARDMWRETSGKLEYDCFVRNSGWSVIPYTAMSVYIYYCIYTTFY